MNPRVYSLFSLEEIFHRLGQGKATGWLHVFTPESYADVYLEQGEVVAVTGNNFPQAGMALTTILTWRTAHTVWMEGHIPPPNTPLIQPRLALLPILLNHSIAQDNSASKVDDILAAADLISSTRPLAQVPATLDAQAPLRIFSSEPNGELATTVPLPRLTAGSVSPAASSTKDEIKADVTPGWTSVPKSSIQETATSAESAKLVDTVSPGQYLLMIEHKENGSAAVPLEKISNIVGRHLGCDVVIDHPSVSRRHCLLQVTETGVQVRDLGSTNGTQVGGQPATNDGVAKDGDELTIGFVPVRVRKQG